MNHTPLLRTLKAVMDSDLPPKVRAYLMVVAAHLGKDYTCWPANERVAAAMGLTVSSVEKTRRAAIAEGVIESRRRRYGSALTVVNIKAIEARSVAPQPEESLEETPEESAEEVAYPEAQEPEPVTAGEPESESPEPEPVAAAEPEPVTDKESKEESTRKKQREGREEPPHPFGLGPLKFEPAAEPSLSGLEAVCEQLARWAGHDIGSAGRRAAQGICTEFNGEPVEIRGEPVPCDLFVKAAIDDAIGGQADYGNPRSAQAYVRSIIVRCRDEQCMPGDRKAADTRPRWKRDRDEAVESKLAAVRAARAARQASREVG